MCAWACSRASLPACAPTPALGGLTTLGPCATGDHTLQPVAVGHSKHSAPFASACCALWQMLAPCILPRKLGSQASRVHISCLTAPGTAHVETGVARLLACPHCAETCCSWGSMLQNSLLPTHMIRP